MMSTLLLSSEYSGGEPCAFTSSRELYKALEQQSSEQGRSRTAVALETIFNKGWGCFRCPENEPEQHSSSTATLLIAGTSLTPTYELLKQEGVYLQRSCPASGQQGRPGPPALGTPDFNQLATTALPGGPPPEVVECHSVVKNCAVCSADPEVGEYECVLCLDGFTRLSLVSADGSEEQTCLPAFCPKGQRLVQNFNGISYCEPCGIQNCAQCSLVAGDEEPYEECLECFAQFSWDAEAQ